MMKRRQFIGQLGLGIGALGSTGLVGLASGCAKPAFKISLAQWSLHRAFFRGEIGSLDFPVVARERFGISAVEYVNQFYKEQVGRPAAIRELRNRANGSGVQNLLIMVDGEGDIGAPDPAARDTVVENHLKWLEMAAELGCHSIRVNAAGPGKRDELAEHVTQGLRQLATRAVEFDLNVLVENHGGFSSDAEWLSGVMRSVNMSNCGTLPDFGNFCIRKETGPDGKQQCAEEYDRYRGVTELMPFARAVSAKSYDFASDGSETTLDYPQLLKIVTAAGYSGFVGIEFEGSQLSEDDGILKTKSLLESLL